MADERQGHADGRADAVARRSRGERGGECAGEQLASARIDKEGDDDRERRPRQTNEAVAADDLPGDQEQRDAGGAEQDRGEAGGARHVGSSVAGVGCSRSVRRSASAWNSGRRMTSGRRGRGKVDRHGLNHRAGAAGEHDDAIGEKKRLADIVRHQEGGDAILLPDALQLDVHLPARHGIERAEGFVEQQHVGTQHQGAGDGGALSHAAGQLLRSRRLEAGQADEADQIGDAGFVDGPAGDS